MIDITFKQVHRDRLRTIPIHSKKARGQMIHFTISKQIDNAAGLKEFDLDGYYFTKEDSTANEWLFIKKE